MGHQVTKCPIVPADTKISRSKFPNLDDHGMALVSGPEYIGKHFRALYPERKIPSVAWMHESVEREDYGMLDVDAIKRTADVIFCPARQDTKYGFEFIPFGVDTAMFYSSEAPRDIELAFIGMIYPKRQ